ncbi:hypothetical protein FZEAL_4522 [Fusarium zealandicum]|uniref:chitin synthase n=1 Tax=Fusarium zealandicum TaxID=1053134 RepID=A0A8H4XKQ9_9HYPO|nr:hypothetical protein FZEAL_4522 [Fusarium zealandicum]
MANSSSITGGCADLITTIETLSAKIHSFVRTCREARRDLDRVSRELQSLRSVLVLIEEDAGNGAKSFPQKIGQHISGIISNCSSVVVGIQSCIEGYEDGRATQTGATWATVGHGDLARLCTGLEIHKAALELALDLLFLAIVEDITTETTAVPHHDTTAIKDNAAQILDEITRVQSQLPNEARVSKDNLLQRFLEEAREYTEAAIGATFVEDDGDAGSPRALSTHKEQDNNALPVLEPPKPPASMGFNGLLLSPDGLMELPKEDDQQQPKSASPSTQVEAHNGSSPDESYQQRPNSTELSRSTMAQDLSEDENVCPVSPPLPLPPRPQPGNYQSQAIEGQETGEYSNIADRSGARNDSRMLDNTAREERREAEKLRENFYAAARDESKRQVRESERLKHNKPTSDSRGVHAKSFNGNLAIDCQIPERVLELDPTRPPSLSDELTHWRFTAVTCPAEQFVSQNYLLRPFLFSNPRPIRIILNVQLDPNEPPSDFVKRWSLIRKSIETLETLEQTRDPDNSLRAPLFPSGTKAWKHIVVHIHGPMNWKGVDESITNALETMGVRQQLEPALYLLDDSVLYPPYQDDATTLQEKTVHCTIRECTTRLSPHLKTFSKHLGQFTAGIPIQIICSTPRGTDDANLQGDYKEWTTAIAQLLRPELVIDMTKFKESGGEKRFFLWNALAHKGRLVSDEETSDSGLKVIDFVSMRTQMREIEKARRKASHRGQRQSETSEGDNAAGA